MVTTAEPRSYPRIRRGNLIAGVARCGSMGGHLAVRPGADSVPGFVYAITLTQLILFSAFGLNQALQYAQVGKWRSYLFGETTYITLSLIAKSLLAWIIYANILRPA